MKKINIKVETNEQAWNAARHLKELGYRKVADCYWFEDWINDETGARACIERA